MRFTRSCRWTALLVLFALVAGPAFGQRVDRPEALRPILIQGRVVDEAGLPVAGLRINATSSGLGRYLSRVVGDLADASLCQATSGEDGRFSIPVPYAGLRYILFTEHGQHHFILRKHRRNPSVMVGDGDKQAEIEVVARAMKVVPPVTGRVLMSDGAPAAGARVVMKHGDGQRWEMDADEQGRFEFIGMRVPDSPAFALLAEAGGEVGWAKTPRWNRREPMTIRLSEPASVSGRVLEAETGEVVAGVRVSLMLKGTALPAYTAEADDQGRFRITGLPSGAYGYRAYSETHVDAIRRGADHERSLTLEPGGRGEVTTFNLRPMAVLRGRFVNEHGTPIPGALVSYSGDGGVYGGRQLLAYTDAQGRFTFRTGHFHHHYNPIEAFHPIAGGSWYTIKDNLSPGQTVDDIEIVAHGVARVHGTVTDPQGKPIQGVACSYAHYGSVATLSGPDGGYDLGLITLRPPQDGKPLKGTLQFLPPRPDAYFREAVPDEPGPYYVASSRYVALRPDDVLTEDAQLKQTERLTFTGAVRDDNGRAVPRAWVYLLPGRVTDATEQDKQRVEYLIKHTESRRRHERDSLLQEAPAIRLLDDLRVDQQGRWGFALLRSDGDADVYRILLANYLRPREAGAPPPEDLAWVTVLAVPDDGPYRLYPPTRITEDDTHYVIPAAQAGDDRDNEGAAP